MEDSPKERWKVLCEQIATEQDGTKLLALIREINDLLEANQVRSKTKKKTDQPT
jgi:hypothetical protein